MDLNVLGQHPDENEKTQELSIICEETLTSEEPCIPEQFENLSGFHFDTNLPRAIEDFGFHGDSDESLGILPLDLLDDANEVFSENSSKDSFSFVKIDSEHDFIDNLNVVKENLFKANDLLVKHEIHGLSTNHLSELQCDLNAAQATHSAEEQNDLNVILKFHNHTFEYDKFKPVVSKINADEECQSPVCTLPNILLNSKFEESPIFKASSSPKYSSTPKHDINTTFALDERLLNSEQNLSPVSSFTKTLNKDALQEKAMFTNIDKLDQPLNVTSDKTVMLSSERGKNLLNTTYNITALLCHQDELNKTFNNVFNVGKEIVTEKHENTFNLKDKRDEIKVTALYCEKDPTHENIQRNVSNIGISLPEEFGNKIEALTLEGHDVAVGITPPEFKDFENDSYEEGIATNVLDKTQILNTTYEKIDELPQSSKMVTSKLQKPFYKQVEKTNISKIAKGIYFNPFSSTASNCKSIEPDKKSTRKSICTAIGNNSKTLNKEALKRRQTLGNTLIRNDNVIVSNVGSQTTKNAANSSHYSMSKNLINGKSCRSLKFASKPKDSSAEASRTPSDLSLSISRVSSGKTKVKFSGEVTSNQLQLKQLGETVILTEKTAINKSILPPKKTFNKCETPTLLAQTSGRKTSESLPKHVKVFQKAHIPSVEFTGKKITLSGIPEKSVLSKKNSSDYNVPGASFTQILNRKSSSTGSSSNNYQTRSVTSKIPTTNKIDNGGSSSNNYQTRSVTSKIPTTNKKIDNGEKAAVEKPKTCYLKNLSHRNLR